MMERIEFTEGRCNTCGLFGMVQVIAIQGTAGPYRYRCTDCAQKRKRPVEAAAT